MNDAKKLLEGLRKIDLLKEQYEKEREQWMSIATGTTARMGGERVQTSGSKDKMADAVAELVDIERDIERRICELYNRQRYILSAMEELEKEYEYEVLYKRYVECKMHKEIDVEMNQKNGWSSTVHGRALVNIQKILDERSKCGVL